MASSSANLTSILTLRTPSRLFTRARAHTLSSEPPEKNHASRDTHPPPPLLLHFNDLPAWYQENPSIQTCYRPVSGSTIPCIHSLTYLHNESLNIYTHLLPAFFSLFAQVYIQTYISTYFPGAKIGDRLVFSGIIAAGSITMVLSSVYHLLNNHSHIVSGLFLRLDYLGILTLILGSFSSGIFVGFYCDPFLQKVYWGMISGLSIITSLLVLHPQLQGLKFRPVRTAAFIATAASGFAPIAHGIAIYGWQDMWQRSGLPYWLLEGAVYALGAFFFVSRFPEKRWPVRFDVWGGSHQIFHVLVVVAGMVHFWGVWEAFKWNYVNDHLCLARGGG